MLSTLICVFTLDRIGRRMTLYWGAVVQGIALILAGVFTRLTLENQNDNGVGTAKSNQFGGAAVFFVFLYTAAFGATWLTVPWLYPTVLLIPCHEVMTLLINKYRKSGPYQLEQKETLGVSWVGVLGMDGVLYSFL
jgi:hypothetical protein